ncbi:hypothetical protein KUD11_00315 [Roseovarius sp. LXJ103]|uniref:hypothetical protein n=1 Tax=Roseovarius carneus TaxID=2853164 RepID=UPI000D60C16A|nr:hypothetical protein [Roseovarius carneus]MBZ8117084.1 hypothetical protein [Roseovarius carneus]PWE37069.1 hypothetical protein DD563_14610 [Pelagicola sp. LXJ1103]
MTDLLHLCAPLHTLSDEAMILEGVDTVVMSLGHVSQTALADALVDWPVEMYMIGDCLSPRTVEEAILEGLGAGLAV